MLRRPLLDAYYAQLNRHREEHGNMKFVPDFLALSQALVARQIMTNMPMLIPNDASESVPVADGQGSPSSQAQVPVPVSASSLAGSASASSAPSEATPLAIADASPSSPLPGSDLSPVAKRARVAFE